MLLEIARRGTVSSSAKSYPSFQTFETFSGRFSAEILIFCPGPVQYSLDRKMLGIFHVWDGLFMHRTLTSRGAAKGLLPSRPSVRKQRRRILERR